MKATIGGGDRRARRTIAREVSLEGVGLHLGLPCRLTFRPAPAGSGVAFERADREGRPRTEARADVAVLTERQTQLGDGEGALHTVEHVLAAVAGLEIDDLLIEMNGPEPPILDGSAGPYVRALATAGVAQAGGNAEYLSVAEPFSHEESGARYEVTPASAFELEVTIDFSHHLVGEQRGHWTVTPESFVRELADARTFGFAHEIEMLRSQGLIQGASTQNALLLGDEGLVDNALRWPDEFVRHKAMDCVGDLALAGKRVRARIVARRPSHRGTVTLVRELLKRATKEPRVIGIEEIMKVLPHRYPFLLVDRIIEQTDGRRAVGIKNVTINEPFFGGHFPGNPVMPGVLIIEAMAQVGGFVLLGRLNDRETKDIYFTSLDNVKWRRPVRPGDQLRFEVELTQIRGMAARLKGVALVDGAVVAEAEMSAMLRDR
jgi:UDP-3-O-[3-hydroxymyristoyl] N-acetylglucosamine deacetylase/3-hydroxyacyl-[acyl-carrier-protein] dehydratase